MKGYRGRRYARGISAPVLGHHMLAMALRPEPLLSAAAGGNNMRDCLIGLLRACGAKAHRHLPQIVLLRRLPQRDEPCEEDAYTSQHLGRLTTIG